MESRRKEALELNTRTNHACRHLRASIWYGPPFTYPYTNIVAYILQVNGHAAGSKPLRGSSGLAIGTTRGATPPAGATRPTAGDQHGADAGAQAGGRLPSGDDPNMAGP